MITRSHSDRNDTSIVKILGNAFSQVDPREEHHAAMMCSVECSSRFVKSPLKRPKD